MTVGQARRYAQAETTATALTREEALAHISDRKGRYYAGSIVIGAALGVLGVLEVVAGSRNGNGATSSFGIGLLVLAVVTFRSFGRLRRDLRRSAAPARAHQRPENAADIAR